jgi:hypothetical protein
MSTITYRGQLPIGVQAELKLSTNNGLTGYKIKKFQIMSSTPGVTGSVTYVGKVFTTNQEVPTALVSSTVNLNDPGLLAVNYYQDNVAPQYPFSSQIIMDTEIFNQDIFVYITDPDGGTIPANYYLELEKIKLDLNASTVSTLKNIRESKADRL